MVQQDTDRLDVELDDEPIIVAVIGEPRVKVEGSALKEEMESTTLTIKET